MIAKLKQNSWVLSYLLYALAVLSFIFRQNQYEKPLVYYILISLSVATAFYSVIRNHKVFTILVLACLIGLTHIWTEHLMFFNSLIGIDPYAHMRTTTQYLGLAGVGNNPPLTWNTLGGSYSLMHIYLKWVIDITGLDYKWASLIFVGSLHTVLNIVLVYVLGKNILDYKVGLVAALMLSCANWSIFFGEWIIPNSIGATLSLVVAYCMIKIYKDKKYWLIIPICILTVMAYIVHLFAAIWVIGTVGCLLIFYILYNKQWNLQKKCIELGKITPIILILVGSMIFWMDATTMGSALERTANQYEIKPSIQIPASSPTQKTQPTQSTQKIKPTQQVTSIPQTSSMPIISNTPKPSSLPIPSVTNTPIETKSVVVKNVIKTSLLEYGMNGLGMALYLFTSLIGLLLMFKKDIFNKTWVIFCVLFLAIGIIPSMLGVSLFAHRWWFFAQVIISIPLAVFLVRISRFKILASALVVVIVFFSIIGLPSNMTNRDLSANQIVRYALTDKEIQGLEIAKFYNPRKIGSDPFYICYVAKDIEYINKVEHLDLINGDFKKSKADVILIRDAIYKEPFGFGDGAIYKLEYNPVDLAIKQGYKEVWNNEEIHVLIRN